MNIATKERILVTVKTYPTLSRKYGELVCTAGLREDGSWVRIYPVPFRRLSEAEQYSKYDWVEWELARNNSDYRPESFRPINSGDFQSVGHVGTANEWRERKKTCSGEYESIQSSGRHNSSRQGQRDVARSIQADRSARLYL